MIAQVVRSNELFKGNVGSIGGRSALARSLPLVVREPGNVEARSDALYGAWLAGASLGAVAMGLHHKLCHVLGGTFNLPHAETHAIVLPHAAAYNAAAAPAAIRTLLQAAWEGRPPTGAPIAEMIGDVAEGGTR